MRRAPRSTLFPYTTLFRSWMQSSRVGVSTSACTESWAESMYSMIGRPKAADHGRSEEHTSELQSLRHLVCRLLLEKKKFVKTDTLQSYSHTMQQVSVAILP